MISNLQQQQQPYTITIGVGRCLMFEALPKEERVMSDVN